MKNPIKDEGKRKQLRPLLKVTKGGGWDFNSWRSRLFGEYQGQFYSRNTEFTGAHYNGFRLVRTKKNEKSS